MSKDNNEVFRVVEEGSEFRESGYQNATGLFNTLKGARQVRNRALRYQHNVNEYRVRRGEEPRDFKPVRIQKSTLVWEDVE